MQMTKNELPVVSIIGRPNVGKSSLFNRIMGKRHAVVDDRSGTTRDRIEKLIKSNDKSFILVDTGGFLSNEKDEMSVLVTEEIHKAIKNSDVLIFVCDGENGLLPMDIELAHLLRKSDKDMILVINKIDNEKRKDGVFDFYQLGLSEPFAVSSLHNIGIKDLMEKIVSIVPKTSDLEIEKENPIKIAIVGRPNVGKSSFLNRVIEEERVIVHEKPGTTRDAIDIYFKKDGIFFLLIDTAGMRHKRKVKAAVDVYSMMRARDAIARCDVALLIIDGMEGVANDDIKVLNYILEEGKGCVIVVNKWDLVKNIETSKYEKAMLRRIPQAVNFPIAFVSAKTSRNVLNTFNLVKSIKTNSDLFIDEDALGEFLQEINPQGVRMNRKKKIPKFYSMVQSLKFPKIFHVVVDDPRNTTDQHIAFIENRLRETFPLKGVPIKIVFRRLQRKGSKK